MDFQKLPQINDGALEGGKVKEDSLSLPIMPCFVLLLCAFVRQRVVTGCLTLICGRT
jgi:hypothetical protein